MKNLRFNKHWWTLLICDFSKLILEWKPCWAIISQSQTGFVRCHVKSLKFNTVFTLLLPFVRASQELTGILVHLCVFMITARHNNNTAVQTWAAVWICPHVFDLKLRLLVYSHCGRFCFVKNDKWQNIWDYFPCHNCISPRYLPICENALCCLGQSNKIIIVRKEFGLLVAENPFSAAQIQTNQTRTLG